MIPAAIVWPLPTAIALSWIGNMGASTIAFVMARWLARAWAQRHLPTRLRRWDQRLADGGIAQVTLLRVATGQLTPADWLLGVSNVGIGAFLVGTGLGIIPGILLVTTVGGGLVEVLMDGTPLLPVLVVATIALLIGLRRRRESPSSSG